MGNARSRNGRGGEKWGKFDNSVLWKAHGKRKKALRGKKKKPEKKEHKVNGGGR